MGECPELTSDALSLRTSSWTSMISARRFDSICSMRTSCCAFLTSCNHPMQLDLPSSADTLYWLRHVHPLKRSCWGLCNALATCDVL